MSPSFIARAKTPNLPAKEAGTPVLGSPYPTQKLPVRFSPEGLRKYLIPWGFFPLTYYSPFIVYLTHHKASPYH
jgi:hypothetical protein